MIRAATLALPWLLIAALLGAWEAACRLLHVPPYFLPPPSAIGAALVSDWPILLSSAWNTLAMALAAGDKAQLSRADGVGPKLAARIAAELKDKAQTQSLRIVVGRSDTQDLDAARIEPAEDGL